MNRKRKKSITRRFFGYIVFLIVISDILLTAVTSTLFRKHLVREVTDSSISLLQRNLETVNEYLQGIDNVANALIYNQDLIEVVKEKELTAANKDLLDSIFSIFYQSRSDLKLILYKETEPEKAYSIYSGSGVTETGDFHDSEWYRKISSSDRTRIMVSNQVAAYTEGLENENVHVMIYKIKDRFSDICVGYLRVDIDLQNLKRYFVNEYENIDGTSIYDAEGNLLFRDKMTVEIPSGEQLINSDVFIDQDGRYITIYGEVYDIGWTMAFCVDKTNLYADLHFVMIAPAVTAGVVLLFTLLCSGWLFSAMTDNFRRLTEGMESVKRGNLDTQVQMAGEDEVGILIEEFNSTVRNLNDLMHEVEKKTLLLKEVEIKALQQQINPHFIFNCLENIMGLASEGLDDKVITICRGMSSMLRYNISFQSRTRLANEIEQMENYAKLMQIRFENCFEVFYEIDERCLNAEFVKFTLQPLVENAISHGLRDIHSGGLIRILIQKQEDQVEISIFDNGNGMEEKRLEELNCKIHETMENPLDYTEKYSGLGLMNVNLRLRLHFKEQYHIEIFSKPNRGTCIFIKIPFVEIRQER